MNLLHVGSSIRGENSASRAMSAAAVAPPSSDQINRSTVLQASPLVVTTMPLALGRVGTP